MPVLTAAHFAHLVWINIQIDDYGKVSKEDLPKLHECGAPRCAVGNVLTAFGVDCRYQAWDWSPLDEQVRAGEGPVAMFVQEFVRQLYIVCDRQSPHYATVTLHQLSVVFETILRPTEAAAALAWNETIRHFGYTEEV